MKIDCIHTVESGMPANLPQMFEYTLGPQDCHSQFLSVVVKFYILLME